MCHVSTVIILDETKRKGILVYERTSHSSKHKNLTPYKFVANSSPMYSCILIQGPSNLILISKSTPKGNLQVAYFMMFYAKLYLCMDRVLLLILVDHVGIWPRQRGKDQSLVTSIQVNHFARGGSILDGSISQSNSIGANHKF